MLRFLKLLGFGGFVFLISALWIGHTDGLILGLLGFCMIVLSVALLIITSFFVVGGAIIEKGVDMAAKTVYPAAKHRLEQLRDESIQSKNYLEMDTRDFNHVDARGFVKKTEFPKSEIHEIKAIDVSSRN
jgi:hypothetical protein